MSSGKFFWEDIDEEMWKAGVERVLALIATLLIVFLLSDSFQYYYDINDDILIKDILAGNYTGKPSGYSIQMLYPISAVISLFYRIAPSVPWYGLFLIVAQFGSVYVILHRSVVALSKWWQKLGILLVEAIFFTSLFMWEFVHLQYSVTCGFLVAAGIAIFATTDYRCSVGEFLRKNIPTGILLVIAFCIRTEMLMLLLPFCGAMGLFYWIQRDREQRRSFFEGDNLARYSGFLLSIAVLLLVMLGIDGIAYHSGEWREFRDLFQARTQVYDFYGIPDYVANAETYGRIGVSEEEHMLLQNYNFVFNKELDAELLHQIEEMGKVQSGNAYFKVPFGEALYAYLYHVVYLKDGMLQAAVILFYVLLLAVAVTEREWSFLWKLPLLGIIRSGLWMYLFLMNRYPQRITHTLYLTEVVCLFFLLVLHLRSEREEGKELLTRADQEKRRQKKERKELFVTIGCFVWLATVGIIVLPQHLSQVTVSQEQREQVNVEWQQLKEFCEKEPQKLFLLDVYSTVKYSEKVWETVAEGICNYDYAGGWACKSPLQDKKLKHWDASIGETAESSYITERMVDSERIYLISYTDRTTEWLENYYASIGKSVETVCIKQFGGESQMLYSVYAVQSIKE